MSKSSRAVGGPLEPSVKRQVMPTRGPWEYVPKLTASENHHGFFVRAEKATKDGKWALAMVQPGDEDGKLGEANARLIAAAPDLLDVVQALVLAQQQGCDPALMVAEDSPLMDAARDALLKVCGVPAA